MKNKTSKSKVNIPIQKKPDTLAKPIIKLFRYRLIQFSKQKDTELIPHLDLGFSIFLENKEKLSKFKIGSMIESNKENKNFTYQPSSNVKELYTYKAYLERVIDGDTILVYIDLGFSILTKQRLRLRGIDTAELTTKQGLSAKKYIEQELQDCKFLIIKTYSKDKYDRHLVDVFYLKNTTDEKKIIKDGLFLNNELLNEELAVRI